MEIIYAVLVYFGMMQFTETPLTPPQYEHLIRTNQPTIYYYTNNPRELQAIRSGAIDRLED
jgi:hypothetical protein